MQLTAVHVSVWLRPELYRYFNNIFYESAILKTNRTPQLTPNRHLTALHTPQKTKIRLGRGSESTKGEVDNQADREIIDQLHLLTNGPPLGLLPRRRYPHVLPGQTAVS